MRIIAGTCRGRPILPPVGETTRPITDRVKQSLFDIVFDRIDGSVVYDLFAGTGSMGLECLSRGARNVLFIESDPSAVELLRKNLHNLGLARGARVVSRDVFSWLAGAPGPDAANRAALVFLDPPYRMIQENPAALATCAATLADRHLAADGIVIFRHHRADALALVPLAVYDERHYGAMTLTFLKKA
jgi:16S rRNA (guanine(966)-N(2))-methyltransferase RsmD